MKQLTMEQLTHRMGSLAEGQQIPAVIGAALNMVFSCVKATEDRTILTATALTLLEMLEVLRDRTEEPDQPKIQLQ